MPMVLFTFSSMLMIAGIALLVGFGTGWMVKKHFQKREADNESM